MVIMLLRLVSMLCTVGFSLFKYWEFDYYLSGILLISQSKAWQ